MKQFHWSDLQKLVDKNFPGRTHGLLVKLLSGERVDISLVPHSPGKQYRKRRPSAFRGHWRDTMKKYTGVLNEGTIYWIDKTK